MPTQLPPSHIDDALSLKADAKIDLFQLQPLAGGTVYFKADNPVTWQGDEYEGLPCSIGGDEMDIEKRAEPTLQIGQEDLDLLPFKGLIHDGLIDGATIVRRTVLLQDILDDQPLAQVRYYRVKRIESYSRTQLSLVLASFSGANSQTIPFRQYLPPDFPYVNL